MHVPQVPVVPEVPIKDVPLVPVVPEVPIKDVPLVPEVPVVPTSPQFVWQIRITPPPTHSACVKCCLAFANQYRQRRSNA